MRTLALLATGLALATLAAAAPLAVVPLGFTQSYVGLATQGSADESRDWYPWSPVCLTVLTRFQVTLEVVEGSEGDVLALEVPGAGVAIARPGQPATLEAVQGDSCPDFTVRGAQVRHAALYRVESATGHA